MNIRLVLKKELEKGNLCITENGDVMSVEKYTQKVKKVYLEKAKEGDIDITLTSFNDYLAEHRNYMNTALFLKEIDKLLLNSIYGTFNTELQEPATN